MSTIKDSPEMIELVPGVEITDAFIDFNLRCSNKPDLYLSTNNRITPDHFQPVSDGNANNQLWLAETEGVFAGFRKNPPGASEGTKNLQKETEVEHETEDEVERYQDFPHNTANHQNKREPASVLNVSIQSRTLTQYPIRATRVQGIIDQYLNGPLGSDIVSYWYAKREHESGSWAQANSSRGNYDGYVRPESDIVLVYDSTYTWYPSLEADLSEDDLIFSSDEPKYGVLNKEHNSLWRLESSSEKAHSQADRLRDQLDQEFNIEKLSFS